MILSDTIKVKYKFNTCGLQTHEVAKLLRDKGVSGFLIATNERSVVMLVPRENKAHNRKVLNELKGVMASEL